MDDDDSRCIDRHANRTLARAAQCDAQIKDLDVSSFCLFPRQPATLILSQSNLREHLGNFRAIESSIKGALAELNVCAYPDMLLSRSFTAFHPPHDMS